MLGAPERLFRVNEAAACRDEPEIAASGVRGKARKIESTGVKDMYRFSILAESPFQELFLDAGAT